ncbi:MAG TPA: hypothetical protein VF572_00875 [Candidatus Saccharimonadales bacterium]|jgi:hypothetical protein
MGDVLWTAEAVALNEGFYLEGTFGHSSVADKLPEGEIKLSDIDTVARIADIEWDVPAVRALYGLSSKEVSTRVKEGNIETAQLVLGELSHQLGKSARMARVLDLDDGWTRLQELRVAEALAQTVLLVSSLAQTRTGSSLGEVIYANRKKLTARLATKAAITKFPRGQDTGILR